MRSLINCALQQSQRQRCCSFFICSKVPPTVHQPNEPSSSWAGLRCTFSLDARSNSIRRVRVFPLVKTGFPCQKNHASLQYSWFSCRACITRQLSFASIQAVRFFRSIARGRKSCISIRKLYSAERSTRRGSKKGAGRTSSQKRAGRSSGTGAARASSPQRFISFGAMGWALAAAIAAVAAAT